MDSNKAMQILLSDYKEPAFWVESVDLHFQLSPTNTRVKSIIKFINNPKRSHTPHALELDGRMLKLISAEINGKKLNLNQIKNLFNVLFQIILWLQKLLLEKHKNLNFGIMLTK